MCYFVIGERSCIGVIGGVETQGETLFSVPPWTTYRFGNLRLFISSHCSVFLGNGKALRKTCKLSPAEFLSSKQMLQGFPSRKLL
jgi:hypothetical protein